MADVTKVKTLKIFSWGRPSASNPRLAAPISSTATTVTLTNAPLDEDDAVVSTDFIMGVKNSDGFTEAILVAASGISVDGLTFTGVTRGIDVSGLDYTTGNTALAADHGQDSAVSCLVHPFNHAQWQAALQGTIASGGENWRIGNEANNDITIYAANGDVNSPFWRYDRDTSAWVYSNDGVSSTPFGTGAGVTGGDGIDVTAGAISVDIAATNDLQKITGGELDTNLTASKTEIDQLAGTTNIAESDTFFGSTDITGAQAETLTDTSNAEALHTHTITNNGTTTRAAATASGSEAIAHGLGVVPKMIIFNSTIAVAGITSQSTVDDDGDVSTNVSGVGTSTSLIVRVRNATDYQDAAFTSSDATNINIAWTKGGSGQETFVSWTAIV